MLNSEAHSKRRRDKRIDITLSLNELKTKNVIFAKRNFMQSGAEYLQRSKVHGRIEFRPFEMFIYE
jgi:hypothetical protein